ncbi:MAG: DNA-3-methyladenine glycosylase, partial [Terrimicrobiaceae bacterium]
MLKRPFFERDPLSCAHELVGCRLHWAAFAGIVVETEAYDVDGDEACHAAFRPSARAFVASHEAGAAYVYLNYGVHWMLNVLVKGKRLGFVLIRALEPVAGIEQMKSARGTQDVRHLCSGPGKLTRALGVTGRHHGMD